MTRILDGKQIAAQIRQEVAAEIRDLGVQGITPGLAVVLVGENPASQVYVQNKTRSCLELGIHSRQINLPAETSLPHLLQVIGQLNDDDHIDGILVQLPLPSTIDEETVLESVRPDKDVDGFHPVNVGRLVIGRHLLAPCTPLGILEMLKREGVPLQGAEAVVAGRSNIVGKPLALLLLHENATVTICHSRTRDLAAVCRRADLLVAAVGRPALITAEFIKEGAVVVDVGVNRLESRREVVRLFGEGSEKVAAFDRRGSILVGDVHPSDPIGRASAVTPVPGGVGPLTIAQLMKNTLAACRNRRAPDGKNP